MQGSRFYGVLRTLWFGALKFQGVGLVLRPPYYRTHFHMKDLSVTCGSS